MRAKAASDGSSTGPSAVGHAEASRGAKAGVPEVPEASAGRAAVPVPRSGEEPSGSEHATGSGHGSTSTAVTAAGLDVAVGVAHLLYRGSASAVDVVGRRLSPVTGLLLHPPFVNPRHAPATILRALAAQGRVDIESLRQQARDLTTVLVPQILRVVLDSIDATELVAERLDLDRLAAVIDVDAVVDRVDVDRVVGRVDVDGVVDRVDVDAVVDRVDVDDVVDRVDVLRVVNRIDLDAVVDRMDLDAVVGRIDVDAVMARADPQAVLDRVDLVGITRQILDALDLPAIIRDSSSFLASDAVHTLRARSASADEAVGSALSRLMPGSRLLARRRGREAARTDNEQSSPGYGPAGPEPGQPEGRLTDVNR